MSSGRIRKNIINGCNRLIEKEMGRLQAAAIFLEAGETFSMETGDREYGFVLISGETEALAGSDVNGVLGPRENPYGHKPSALLATREQKVTFKALRSTLIGVGSAPAERKLENMIITPSMVGGGARGQGNWQREVRFVIWTDNSTGNSLIMGETVVPSGNWSTMPPHRHQYDIPGEEVPYEEVYFFQFSRPGGFGLAWQFDDDGGMDQAFSLKSNDVIYMDRGYHPLVCGPGAELYQLTMMAGPYRTSKSRIHDDYKFLLEERGMENPYASQYIKT
jgi:5-deoxy-glucuronate isomerase